MILTLTCYVDPNPNLLTLSLTLTLTLTLTLILNPLRSSPERERVRSVGRSNPPPHGSGRSNPVSQDRYFVRRRIEGCEEGPSISLCLGSAAVLPASTRVQGTG